MFEFSFGGPKFVVNECLGAGYFVNFHWTKSDCKNGQEWDLKKEHREISPLF
jgi:hypothetical protein